MTIHSKSNEFKAALWEGRVRFAVAGEWDVLFDRAQLRKSRYDCVAVEAGPSMDAPPASSMTRPLPRRPEIALSLTNNDPAVIRRALGWGIQTLMLPAPGNRRDLQACISAIRYGPFELALNSGNTQNQLRPAFGEPPDEEICLLVRLGPCPPLERLSEFASVEGVDGFVLENVETTDAGYLSEAAHRMRIAGKAPGIKVASAQDAHAMLAFGFKLVVTSKEAEPLHMHDLRHIRQGPVWHTGRPHSS